MAKIMLVEDDVNLREIYAARLLAQGYEVVTASDGEEALASAVKETPDLIVLDVMMPKISGFDVLDILRSTPETKQSKVIMMTALSQQSDRERGERLGADRYLVKSQVTLEDVVNTVDELLNPNQATQTPSAVPTSEPAGVSSTTLVSSPIASSVPSSDEKTSTPPAPAEPDVTSTPITPSTDLGPADASSDSDQVTVSVDDASGQLDPNSSSSPSSSAQDSTPDDGAVPNANSEQDDTPAATPVSSVQSSAPPPDPMPSPDESSATVNSDSSSTPQSPQADSASSGAGAQSTSDLTIHQPPPEPASEAEETAVQDAALPAEPTPVATTADIESVPTPELDETLSEDSLTPLDDKYAPPATGEDSAAVGGKTDEVLPAEPAVTPDGTPETAPAENDSMSIPVPSFPPDEPPAPAMAPINSSNPQPGETIVPTSSTSSS
jgi:CheY-like chemotaxis protein